MSPCSKRRLPLCFSNIMDCALSNALRDRPVQNKRDRRLRQLHPLLLCSKEKEIRADGVIVFALLRCPSGARPLSLLIPLSIIPSGWKRERHSNWLAFPLASIFHEEVSLSTSNPDLGAKMYKMRWKMEFDTIIIRTAHLQCLNFPYGLIQPRWRCKSHLEVSSPIWSQSNRGLLFSLLPHDFAADKFESDH